jgi:hypothetical protein
MKIKTFIIIAVCIGLVIIISIFFLYYNNKELKLKTSNVTRVTIQHKADIISIDNSNELNDFLNYLSELEFILNSSAIGSKGWTYWVKCYSSDKLVYDFTIRDKDTIVYNNFFYKTKKYSIDFNYMENFFN